MKKSIYLSIFISLSITLNANNDIWTQKSSLSVGRTTHAAFSLGDKGYVCCGMISSSPQTDTDELWQYDPSTNTWSQKAQFPGGKRRELTSFVIDSFAYVGHGRSISNNQFHTSFYKYNARTNSWSQIEDCPVERYTSTGFSIDGKGYVTCGVNSVRHKDLFQYDPSTDSWTQKQSLPSGALNRAYACVVVKDSKAYLVGGFEGLFMDELYVYNPTNNSWTEKATFPGGKRAFLAGLVHKGKILMGMGFSTGNAYQDWYEYIPSTDKWEEYNEFPEDNVFGHGTFTIGDKSYVVAGSTLSGNVRNYLHELSGSSTSVDDKAKISNKSEIKVKNNETNIEILSFNKPKSIKVINFLGQTLVETNFELIKDVYSIEKTLNLPKYVILIVEFDDYSISKLLIN